MSHVDTVFIDVSLVRELIAMQFPKWKDLPITPVKSSGWDNSTFHLGDHISIRLPCAESYAAQVEKEHKWLPILAPLLPVQIPAPIAMGNATKRYPWPWSIYHWLEGDTASKERIKDLPQFAIALAEFLVALQRCDASGGPAAGAQNFYRGGLLAIYDEQTRQAITILGNEIDTEDF